MSRRNVVTIVFLDDKLKGDDCIINEFFENSEERDTEFLMQIMEPYIVHSSIIRSKRNKIMKCLTEQDYKTFYKTIEKMAKEAQKDL